MAKVTTMISVRGTDLKEMLREAQEQMAELTDTPFTVTQIDLYAIDDVAAKDGMVRLWSGSFSMEADVSL